MLVKTRGIVLNYVKYKETSIIVKIFTEEFGIQSYILNGIRSTKAKTKIALFQPLTLLELVVYHKEKQDIHHISEVKCAHIYHSIPFEIKKITISAFMVEIFQKSAHSGEKNGEMFGFFYDFLVELDEKKLRFENMHILFMYKLAKYLGFEPENLNNFIGQVERQQPRLIATLSDPEIKTALERILTNEELEQIPNTIRSSLIDIWLAFYQTHHDNFGELKSLKVLREM